MDKQFEFKLEERTEDAIKFEDIEIDKIFSSSRNPRFTLINDLDKQLIDTLSCVDRTQDEIAKDLLTCEGDFSDLLALLKSINDNGWINNEPVYVVKRKENDGYVVAEGNRRFLAISLLVKKFPLPNYDELHDSQKNSYANEATEKEELDSDEDLHKKSYENYSRIAKIINEFKFKVDKEYKVTLALITDEDQLWNKIYNKHLAGEQNGMRKWSRAKYFADLLSIFNDGFDPKHQKENEFCLHINSEPKKVRRDFQSAQFVYACFYFDHYDDDNQDDNSIKWSEKEILNKLIFSNKISALEPLHSFKKINLWTQKNVGWRIW